MRWYPMRKCSRRTLGERERVLRVTAETFNAQIPFYYSIDYTFDQIKDESSRIQTNKPGTLTTSKTFQVRIKFPTIILGMPHLSLRIVNEKQQFMNSPSSCAEGSGWPSAAAFATSEAALGRALDDGSTGL